MTAAGFGPAGPAAASGPMWEPITGMTWQYQLSGTVDTTVDAQVYDVDLVETPQSTIDALHTDGRRVVCYFSAGSYEAVRPDAGRFPRKVLGKSLDAPFESERWLDIRSKTLRPIMEARLDTAKAKACDGVEPDNVDGFANKTGFKLTAKDQLAYDRFLADAAHRRGLAAGLKNDPKQVRKLEPSFDFAVVEQCFQFDECGKYGPFIDANKPVFEVEYRGDPARFCPEAARLRFSTLQKDINLGPRRVACAPAGT